MSSITPPLATSSENTLKVNQHLFDTMSKKLSIISFTKVGFAAGLLYCTALAWTGFPRQTV